MAATSLATAIRNATVDAISTGMGNAGKWNIYDGTRPSAGGAATTLLAQFTMGTPFAAAAAAGVISPTLPASTTGAAAGTATWARGTNSAGTWQIDCDVTLTAGAGPCKLDNTSIAVGQTVTMTACSFTAGNP